MKTIPPCDKCDKPNPNAAESNYCPQCREDYQRRAAESYRELSGYSYGERRTSK